MLICGRCNPPPVSSEGYRGPYFDSKVRLQPALLLAAA